MSTKKRKKLKVNEKASRNDIIRRNEELYDENLILKRNAAAATENYKALVLVSTRLYELDPEDEIFSKGIFQPSFMEIIKEQSEKRKKEFEGGIKEAVGEVEKTS